MWLNLSCQKTQVMIILFDAYCIKSQVHIEYDDDDYDDDEG